MIDIPNGEILMPTLFASLMIVSGFLWLVIPETNNCKLPQTMSEANAVR